MALAANADDVAQAEIVTALLAFGVEGHDALLRVYGGWVGKDATVPGRTAILDAFRQVTPCAIAERLILSAIAQEDSSAGSRRVTGTAAFFLMALYRDDSSLIERARDQFLYSANPRVQQVLATSLPADTPGLAVGFVEVYRSSRDPYLKDLLLTNAGMFGDQQAAIDLVRMGFAEQNFRSGMAALVHLTNKAPGCADAAAAEIGNLIAGGGLPKALFLDAFRAVARIKPERLEPLGEELLSARLVSAPELSALLGFVERERLRAEADGTWNKGPF